MGYENARERLGLQVIARLQASRFENAELSGDRIVVGSVRLSLDQCIQDPESAYRVLLDVQDRPSGAGWHSDPHHTRGRFAQHIAQRG